MSTEPIETEEQEPAAAEPGSAEPEQAPASEHTEILLGVGINPGRLPVRATALGFDGFTRRYPGDAFYIADENGLATWMEPVGWAPSERRAAELRNIRRKLALLMPRGSERDDIEDDVVATARASRARFFGDR